MKVQLPNRFALVALKLNLPGGLLMGQSGLSSDSLSLADCQPGSTVLAGGVKVCRLLQPPESLLVQTEGLSPVKSSPLILQMEEGLSGFMTRVP